MAEGINLKREIIIDVNLEPTKGSETGKVRPCVVVTKNVYNKRVPGWDWVLIRRGLKPNYELS